MGKGLMTCATTETAGVAPTPATGAPPTTMGTLLEMQ